jgi:hypothetical protein
MYKKIKRTLLCGLGIFAVCALLLSLNASWPLLWFVFLTPGVLYGITLSADVESKYSPVLFVIASTVLYIACFCMVHPGRDDDLLIPRIFLASATGSLLLFSSYYLIISRNFLFWRTLLYSLLTGIISAIPACICDYYFAEMHGESTLLYIGIFSIYPIWQIAFSILINTCQITTSAGDQSALDEHNNDEPF